MKKCNELLDKLDSYKMDKEKAEQMLARYSESSHSRPVTQMYSDATCARHMLLCSCRSVYACFENIAWQ